MINVEWFIETLYGFKRSTLLSHCQVNLHLEVLSLPFWWFEKVKNTFYLDTLGMQEFPWEGCHLILLKFQITPFHSQLHNDGYTEAAVQLEKEVLKVPRYWMHNIGYISFIPCLLFNFILDLLQWIGSYQDNFFLYPDGIRSTACFQEYNIIL